MLNRLRVSGDGSAYSLHLCAQTWGNIAYGNTEIGRTILVVLCRGEVNGILGLDGKFDIVVDANLKYGKSNQLM